MFCFYWVIKQPYKTNKPGKIILILYMRELRFREVKLHMHSHSYYNVILPRGPGSSKFSSYTLTVSQLWTKDYEVMGIYEGLAI